MRAMATLMLIVAVALSEHSAVGVGISALDEPAHPVDASPPRGMLQRVNTTFDWPGMGGRDAWDRHRLST
jgi:hypothetical protein